tara:strand:- start:367 stop:612 length:246 start_codon:yes stop_codon:yes gene_type:complete
MGKKILTVIKQKLFATIKTYPIFKLINRLVEILTGVDDVYTFSISIIIWCFYIIYKRKLLTGNYKKENERKYINKNSDIKK